LIVKIENDCQSLNSKIKQKNKAKWQILCY